MELAPLEYRTRPGLLGLYALLMLPFAALGGWSVASSRGDLFAETIGLGAVAFFGWAGLLLVGEIVRPRVVLTIDAKGVRVRHFFRSSNFDLPWSEFEKAAVVPMGIERMVVLHARRAEWGIANGASWLVKLRRMNVGLVGGWMIVGPRIFGVSPVRLAEEIERYGRHYTPDAPMEYPRPIQHRG